MLSPMKQNYLLSFFFALTLLFASCTETGKAKSAVKYDPWIHGHDTVFHLQFSKDTSTTDFYNLISFIESKSLFSGFDKKSVGLEILFYFKR
jgi:hypothetical protein